MTQAIEKFHAKALEGDSVIPTVDHDADQVRRLHSRFVALGIEKNAVIRQQLEVAAQAGEILNRRKAQLDHGQFMPWLEAYFPDVTPRQLQKYMRLSAQWDKIEPLLDSDDPPTSINKALAAIAEKKPALDPTIPGREQVIHLWSRIGTILYPNTTKPSPMFSVEIDELHKTFVFRDHRDAWAKWNQINDAGQPIGRHLLMLKQQKRTQGSDLAAEYQEFGNAIARAEENALGAPTETSGPSSVNPFTVGDLVFDGVRVEDTKVLEVNGDYCRLSNGRTVRWDGLELVCRGSTLPGTATGEVEAVVPSAGHPDESDEPQARAPEMVEAEPGLLMPTRQPVEVLKSTSKDGDDNKAVRNTPEKYWKPGLEVWGIEAFDIDPMTNDESTVPDGVQPSTVPALIKYTTKEDGLSQPWVIEDKPITYLWANPDFGKNKEFVAKLKQELATGKLEAIVLDKHDHRSAWCQELVQMCSAMCLVDHGPRFEGVDSEGQPLEGSFFPVTLFFFGSLVDRFAQAYGHLGSIVVPYRPTAPSF